MSKPASSPEFEIGLYTDKIALEASSGLRALFNFVELQSLMQEILDPSSDGMPLPPNKIRVDPKLLDDGRLIFTLTSRLVEDGETKQIRQTRLGMVKNAEATQVNPALKDLDTGASLQSNVTRYLPMLLRVRNASFMDKFYVNQN